MLIAEAQRDVRTVYLSGFPGQFVSGLLWVAAAAAATWGRPVIAILVLAVGGMFILPGVYLLLSLMGRPIRLRPDNPFGALGQQAAFMVPLSIPLVLAATAARIEYFFPAFMVVVGTHYLPFVTLYGMPAFYLLAAGLISGGVVIGFLGLGSFALGGWYAAALLLAFAGYGWHRSTPDRSGPG